MIEASRKNTENPSQSIKPSILLFIMVISAVAIAILMFFEYENRKRDYLRLLEKQASLFINTLSKSTQNALLAAESIEGEINTRFLSSLRLVDELDRTQPLSAERLSKILPITEVEAIYIYNSTGHLIRHSKMNTESDREIPRPIILARLNAVQSDTLLPLVDALNPLEDRIIAMVERSRGGLIAAVINPSHINTLKQSLGIGYILKRFQKEESIEYVVIQNNQTIVAGSFQGFVLSNYSSDSVLGDVQKKEESTSRVLEYPDGPVFESVSPFYLENMPFGVLRLGLAMDEYERLREDAGQRLFLFSAVLIVFGLVFANFLINYRHRKLLHRDLGRLEDYTNTILENLTSGVISVDGAGIIQSINKEAVRLLQVDQSEAIYQHFRVLPDPLRGVIEKRHHVSKMSESTTQGWIKSPEEERLLSIQFKRLENEKNEPMHIFLIDDITDQTLFEAQVKRNQRLGALRNQALSMAHEIKNPLNGMKLIVDLIRDKFSSRSDNESVQKQLNLVSQEIQRINDIVEQYLRFARPPKLVLGPIHFPEFLEEVIQLYHPQFEEQGVEFGYDFEKHQPLLGDKALLKQVFINLIQNAQESILNDGRIEIHGKVHHSFYEVSIMDNGKGIPETDLDSMFDLHFTTKDAGSGIGLAVVQQILEAHQALIEVESQAGKGTQVRIRFPIESVENGTENDQGNGK